MSCRRHDTFRPIPPFQGNPRDCAFPKGWGRCARQPEPPRRPWWGPWLGVLFVVGTTLIVVVMVRGLIRP